MAKIEIFGLAESTYTRVVRMACEEKGIDYELKKAPPHSADIDAVHPFGKVPVMRAGDFELCESKAIATYLDRAFPGPKLIPDDPKLAALVEQWISLVNTVIDHTLIRDYLFHYIFPKTADGKPDRAAIDALVPKLKDQIGILDKAVARTGYLAGNSFTLADINLLPALFYVRQFPEGAEAMAGAPNLAKYYERLATRPSFVKTAPPRPEDAKAKAS